MNPTESIKFLQNFTKESELEDLIKISQKGQHSSETDIKVISTVLLEVLLEIEDYLQYFEEEFEKGYGLKTSEEYVRIKESIFSEKFTESIKDVTDLKGLLNVTANFIDSWVNFEKEKVN